MKKLLVPALWIALVFTIAFSVKEAVRAIRETVAFTQDTVRLFTQVEVDAIVRDSSRAFQGRADSAAKRLTGIAERQSRSILKLHQGAESLANLLSQSPDSLVSRQEAITALETYRVALDSSEARSTVLEAIIALRDSQIVQLVQSERLGWRNVDSLTALVRRTPTCRKIPLLGISVPKVGIGYAATTGGHGIGVGVMVPLSCK